MRQDSSSYTWTRFYFYDHMLMMSILALHPMQIL